MCVCACVWGATVTIYLVFSRSTKVYFMGWNALHTEVSMVQFGKKKSINEFKRIRRPRCWPNSTAASPNSLEDFWKSFKTVDVLCGFIPINLKSKPLFCFTNELHFHTLIFHCFIGFIFLSPVQWGLDPPRTLDWPDNVKPAWCKKFDKMFNPLGRGSPLETSVAAVTASGMARQRNQLVLHGLEPSFCQLPGRVCVSVCFFFSNLK